MIINVSASAFASPSLQLSLGISAVTHYASRWQLWSSQPPAGEDGQGDADLLEDSWYDTGNLLSYQFVVADDVAGNLYIRVQYMDSYHVAGEWSEALGVFVAPDLVDAEVEPPVELLPEVRLGPLLNLYDMRIAAEDLVKPVNKMIRYINTYILQPLIDEQEESE